ncbi:unnamed protein product [Cuscuta campestris]|uniref:Glucan endo-1,3-beta-D-glucosidase n=1 Tax=Cuscuta campestris TaxID=132261 RepID=A0A484MG03_9ASTE|nr:unnamed protein product [Cuscuta campestris]
MSALSAPVGVCYGRVGDNLPPPSAVAKAVQSTGISRIRLFNPNAEALNAFSGTGIELMVGVPNEVLPTLANDNVESSVQWLQSTIFAHIPPTQVVYLAVGNEIFQNDQSFYSPFLVNAMVNVHQALQKLGFPWIKVSTPHAASILSRSYPPSAGAFDPTLTPLLLPLLHFLRDATSPLMVNVYPYFSYVSEQKFVSLDRVLFRSTDTETDNNLRYDNMFDATVDAFVYALEREGFGEVSVVVSETGWPTSGGEAATLSNALAYNGNVVARALGNVGTPKRPGLGLEVFLFDLFDENGKGGNEVEKHFGIFRDDGVKAYDINFN